MVRCEIAIVVQLAILRFLLPPDHPYAELLSVRETSLLEFRCVALASARTDGLPFPTALVPNAATGDPVSVASLLDKTRDISQAKSLRR